MKNKIFKSFISVCLAFIMVFGITACVKPETPKTDVEILKEVLDGITMVTETSENLTLPTVDAEKYPDVSLTFSSSNKDAIANDGTVTRSATADVNVTFTVTAKKGETEDFKNFTIKVLKRNLTDAEKVASAKTALTLGDTSAVTDDLTLPSTGENGAVITWATSDNTAITATGLIYPNAYGGQAKTATLTATITINQASDTKTFDITIPALGFNTVPVTYEIDSYTITNVSDAAVLTITGSAYIVESNTDREFFIKIGSAERVEATAVNGTDFEFEVDVTDIPLKTDDTSSDWLDIYMYVSETDASDVTSEKRFEVKGTSAMQKSDIKLANNYVYLFRSYETGGTYYLKLQRYLDETTISRMDDSMIYFELDESTPYLVIEGNIYIDADAESRTITLALYKDAMEDEVLSAIPNEAESDDSADFLFHLDVSSLENSGAWYEPVLIIEENNEAAVSTMIPFGDVTNEKRYDILTKSYTLREGADYIKFVVEDRKPILDMSLDKRDDGMYLILEGSIATDWTETDREFLGVEYDYDNAEGALISGVSNLYTDGDSTRYKYEIKLDDLEANSWKLFKIVYTEGANATPIKNYKIDPTWYDDGPRGVITYEGYRLEQQYNQVYFASKPDAKGRFLEISFEEIGGDMYLVLNGKVKNDSVGFGKDILGIALLNQSAVSGEMLSGVENLYEGADTARYTFKINLDELSEHEWNCFYIVFDDEAEGKLYEKEINNGWYESAADLTYEDYSLKLHYHQVYYYTIPVEE